LDLANAKCTFAKLVCVNNLSLRIAVIILLIFSILPETGQLLKLPNLFQHYSEHKESKKQDSFDFLSFLIEHYSANADKSNENEHSDLPFKQSCASANVLMVFERVFEFKIEPIFSFQSKSHYFIVNEVQYLSPAFTIWQPPKI
jgi:hypothetical protein